MRLWSWQLIPYMSDMQFRGQHRELVLILHDWRDRGTTKHLLINRAMEYPKSHLASYAYLYAKEYEKRYGKNMDKFRDEFYYFGGVDQKFVFEPFPDWHNKEYLRVCMANLYEKHFFGIGKSRITDEEWQRICEGYKAITGEEYKI